MKCINTIKRSSNLTLIKTCVCIALMAVVLFCCHHLNSFLFWLNYSIYIYKKINNYTSFLFNCYFSVFMPTIKENVMSWSHSTHKWRKSQSGPPVPCEKQSVILYCEDLFGNKPWKNTSPVKSLNAWLNIHINYSS